MGKSNFGKGILSAGISTGLGMLSGIGRKKRERRQLGYQKELMGLQFGQQQELNKQGQELAYEQWLRTQSPQARKKQFQEAGLSMGLMYGGAGNVSGGTTPMSGGGSASGGNAPNVEQRTMGIELAGQMANIELMKSQANKNNAEAKKIEGVDTAEAKMRIDNLAQGIKNQKAVYRLTEAQEEAVKLDNWITNASKDDKVTEIVATAKRALYDMDIARSQANVDRATINERIRLVGETAVGASIANALAQENIKKTRTEIDAIATGVVQKWVELGQGQQKVDIDKFNAEMKAEFPAVWDVGGSIAKKGLRTMEAIENWLFGTEPNKDKVE